MALHRTKMSDKAAFAKDRNTGGYARCQLQHRHFCFIATCISKIGDRATRYAAYEVFNSQLHGTNDAYDSSRFYEACMVDPAGMGLTDLELEITKTHFWLDSMHQELLKRKGLDND